MAKNETILRFEKVSFEYNPNKPILDDVTFSLRSESKITIMGPSNPPRRHGPDCARIFPKVFSKKSL